MFEGDYKKSNRIFSRVKRFSPCVFTIDETEQHDELPTRPSATDHQSNPLQVGSAR